MFSFIRIHVYRKILTRVVSGHTKYHAKILKGMLIV